MIYHLHIGDRCVLKSHTLNVLVSICAFKSFRASLMKLGAYRLKIVISFQCIYPFISMKCLKSTLSDTSFATPASFRGPLA
jgi:hypothetical protein